MTQRMGFGGEKSGFWNASQYYSHQEQKKLQVDVHCRDLPAGVSNKGQLCAAKTLWTLSICSSSILLSNPSSN